MAITIINSVLKLVGLHQWRAYRGSGHEFFLFFFFFSSPQARSEGREGIVFIWKMIKDFKCLLKYFRDALSITLSWGLEVKKYATLYYATVMFLQMISVLCKHLSLWFWEPSQSHLMAIPCVLNHFILIKWKRQICDEMFSFFHFIQSLSHLFRCFWSENDWKILWYLYVLLLYDSLWSMVVLLLSCF